MVNDCTWLRQPKARFLEETKYLRGTNEDIEPDDTTSTTENEADEFSIPTTQDQQRPISQTDNPPIRQLPKQVELLSHPPGIRTV